MSQTTKQFTATLVAASITVLVASSAAANDIDTPATNDPVTIDAETCEASWYGPGLQGNDMANGDEFDMDDPTVVAHKSHEFGTILIVTNLANKRATVLKVQDRGPFILGRCVDLSRAGAIALDFYVNDSAGTADVLVEVCTDNCPPAGTVTIPEEELEADITPVDLTS